jgi:hypothetical protein
MSLVRQAVYDNGQVRMTLPGDLIANNEAITSNATVGALNITGAMMATGILSRSGSVAGYADVLPTADDLVGAMLNQFFVGTAGPQSGVGLPQNMSFRFRLINTVAFANTIAVPDTTVTLGANTAVAASAWEEFLITILNGSLPRVVQGNTTNANAIVTGMPDTSAITAGMLVTGTGIAASTTILSVQPGIGVTLSANATATNSNVALTFRPRYRVDSLGGGVL